MNWKKSLVFVTYTLLFLISGTAQKNPLTKAVLSENYKKINNLLEKKKFLVEQSNSLKWTPLVYAVDMGNDSIVKLLIEKGGAKVNITINTGETPLHIAAKKGYSKIVTILLAHKADMEAQDLIRQTPLIAAVRANRYDTAKILLENGANPNHATSSRRTALDWAKTEEMKKLLLKYNAKTYKELYE